MLNPDTVSNPSSHAARRVGFVPLMFGDDDEEDRIDVLAEAGAHRSAITVADWPSREAVPTALHALIDSLQPGDALLVTRLVDLGRNLGQLTRNCQSVLAKGGAVEIASPPFVLCSPEDDALLTILADYSANLHQDRTREGLAAARKRGRIGGKRTTFSEKQIVAAMRSLEQGESLADVAQRVTDRRGRAISPSWLQRRIRSMQQKKNKRAKRKKS